MSRHLGSALSESILTRLSQAERAYDDRAIVINSVDDGGYPHPALLSSQELFAIDRRTLRLTTYAASRTAKNLRERKLVTAILADVDGVYFLKANVTAAHDDGRQVTFDAQVVEVLEDHPTADESARITTGIRFERPPSEA